MARVYDLRTYVVDSGAVDYHALAAAYDLPVIPHGSSVFSHHLQLAFPNCSDAEFVVLSPNADEIVPVFGELFLDEPLPHDGQIALSEKPGWGVEVNRAVHMRRPFPAEGPTETIDSQPRS